MPNEYIEQKNTIRLAKERMLPLRYLPSFFFSDVSSGKTTFLWIFLRICIPKIFLALRSIHHSTLAFAWNFKFTAKTMEFSKEKCLHCLRTSNFKTRYKGTTARVGAITTTTNKNNKYSIVRRLNSKFTRRFFSSFILNSLCSFEHSKFSFWCTFLLLLCCGEYQMISLSRNPDFVMNWRIDSLFIRPIFGGLRLFSPGVPSITCIFFF